MEIQITEKEYCKIDVSYKADADSVSSKRNEIVNKLAKGKVRGFREGKATPEVVKMVYKKEIQDSLKNELSEEAFQNTLFEKNLKPFGRPTFNDVKLSGNNFDCNFTLHVKPEFELKEYKNFEIPKPKDEDVVAITENILQEVRAKHGEMIPYTEDDFVQMTDSIIVNYKGYVGDKLIESLDVTGEILTVGKTTVTAFDENLLGMKIGETREFSIKATENLVLDYLSGQEIKFNVTLVMGIKIIPAALDDELAKKCGFESVDKLRENTQALAADKVTKAYEFNISQQVMLRILENHTFEAPLWVSIPQAQVNAKNHGMVWDTLGDSARENLIKQAANGIKISLIYEKVRDIEPDTQLSDEEAFNIVSQNIKEMAKDNHQTMMQNMIKSGHFQMFVAQVRDQFTLDFIIKTCKIVE